MARTSPVSPTHSTERILANCPALNALREQTRHLASFDVIGHPLVPTVLLEDETGTGKSLLARVTYDRGPRTQGRFFDAEQAGHARRIASAVHRRKVHLRRREHMAQSKHFRVIFEEFFEHRLCYDEPRCGLSG